MMSTCCTDHKAQRRLAEPQQELPSDFGHCKGSKCRHKGDDIGVWVNTEQGQTYTSLAEMGTASVTIWKMQKLGGKQV